MVGLEGDVGGVRIIPPIVEFVDADVNQRYSLAFTVQNVSNFSRRIHFHPPVTDKFNVIVTNPDKPIAPGLEVNAVVEYENDKSEDARDRVLIAVDNDIVEVPLYAYTPTPLLDIEGPIDFGLVVANSHVVSQEVALINHGSIKGSFSINYEGSLPIVITPMSGEVDPKTIQIIKVDLATETPVTIEETATVELEGMKDTKLEIKGRVVEQSLQLLAMDKKTLMHRVTFGPAFYGTDRLVHAYLYNNGPEPVKWVSVLEEGVDGEEAGTDLTKSTLAMLATSPLERIRGRAYDVLTSLVTVIPNQGSIGPYQKFPICFRFSPRFISSNIGWEATEKPPPRQDFALFMSFEMIGSNDSYHSEEGKTMKKVEIALTGTAVPVLVNIQPGNVFDFGEVPCGCNSSTLRTLSNESALLPINIRARKVAHFNVTPVQAKIGPGESQDVMISFQPNQAGSFQTLQIFDVLGRMCENDAISKNNSSSKLSLKSFQVLPLHLEGTSIVELKPLSPKLNPGLTPLLKCEVGPASSIPFDDMYKVKGQVKSAILNSAGSSIHSQRKNLKSQENTKALVAFPNDRAASVRPSHRDKEYQTIFTRTTRHTYVDPDYAYSKEEDLARIEHRNKYKSYLIEQTQKRKDQNKSKEFKKINNDVDLGMKPASGLRPLKLTATEIEIDAATQASPIKDKHRLLTTRQLMTQEQQTINRPVSEGLNALPTTSREKADCKKKLTPQDLHKVIVGPPTIDFGQVCVRSTTHRYLQVVNNLNQFIHVQVVINCKELRQTSPLSQVVPPRAKAQFTLIFESHNEGKFQRSITYSVNSQHESHVLVLAEIVPVNLELSHKNIDLTPEFGWPIEAGYRSIVTLYNRRNHPAEFTWTPILSDRGTAFSIRPATGIVDAYKDLKCEVVFHPSYFAPLEGEFHMQVHNGNAMKLKCIAKLGPVNVKFTERRVLFGNVPLNMVTTKKAVLQNVGQNHAMFYVINSSPFPGMTVSPTHGVVPVGGIAEFQIALNPTAVVKFDTWVQVNIRGWKTIDVRLGGTVEPPEVDIDVKAFKFNGVYCHSNSVIPFNFINLSTTKVCAEIDLSKYSDFSLSFPDTNSNPEKAEIISPHKYEIILKGGQSLPCCLIFNPTSIASYDFTLPVVVNKTGAPSPPPSTFPPTPAASDHHIVTPRQIVITIPTPRRRVAAIALRPILEISNPVMDFFLPPFIMDMHLSESAKGDQKNLVLTNCSDKSVHWELDVKQVKGFLDNCAFSFIKPGGAWYNLNNISGIIPPHGDYTLSINFTPVKSGNFSYTIPLYIQENKTVPYRNIIMNCLIETPKIVFDPLALVLTPVPLSTSVYAQFNLIATGYIKESPLTFSIPGVEADDGTEVSCFNLEFPNGASIPPPQKESVTEINRVTVPCVLTFSSQKPLSTTVDITVSDSSNRKFIIPVTATADNCLLTVYPFLAAHRNDHQIVCEQDKTLNGPEHEANSANLGEAVLLPCTSPMRPSTRGSTSVTSSRFETTSSTSYDDESTNTASDSEFITSHEDGAQPAVPDSSDATGTSKGLTRQSQIPKSVLTGQKDANIYEKEVEEAINRRELISRSLGSAAFPFDSSLEANFHQEVLGAAQRWFSSYGWPGGPYPIQVPYTLRNSFNQGINAGTDAAKSKHGQPSSNAGGTSIKSSSNYSSLKKDVKTVYDMLFHLCGRVVPGISQNQQLPHDITERVIQLHWQHSTLLSFLRGQGASVAAIRPEFLFTPDDYLHWIQIRQRDGKRKECDNEETEEEKDEQARDTIKQPDTTTEVFSSVQIEEDLFESVSKRAWTDLLLQIYKVLVLSRINPIQYSHMKPILKDASLPKVNPAPNVSNVYSVGERIVLAWLNHHYAQQRHLVWGTESGFPPEKSKGGLPPSRWVVNFDYDLLDGLVLATTLAAHCPWLISDYFVEMYTAPATPEQCLHNTLILVKAMRSVGIDYDIQATDITDPNPIALLMFCVHLYQNLPQYLVKTKVEFVGSLHQDIIKQIRLSNSSSRPLKYLVRISGRDAKDFKLPKGDEIIIPSRAAVKLDVVFRGRFIRSSEAVLILVGIRNNFDASQPAGIIGNTLVFLLSSAIDDVPSNGTIRTETPCYEMQKVLVPIINPFSTPAMFRIILIESSDSPPSPLDFGVTGEMQRSTSKTLSSRIKSVRSRTDHGQAKDNSPPLSPPAQELRYLPDSKKSTKSNRSFKMTPQLTSFYCRQSHIFLDNKQPNNLELDFLPFNTGKKFCSLLLVNETVGEFLYSIEGEATLPLPSATAISPTSKHTFYPTRKTGHNDECTVHWKCENDSVMKETLLVPITNVLKERALRIAARQRMSEKEKQRRKLTGTLESGSVTAFIASMGMMDIQAEGDRENLSAYPVSVPPPPRSIKFSVEVSCPWFKAPKTFTIPSPLTFGPKLASDMAFDNSGPNDQQDDGYVPMAIQFEPKGPGHYACDVVLRSPGDVRVYKMDCTVNPVGTNAKLEFHAPSHQAVTQKIPIQNSSSHDWELECVIDGDGFHGPKQLFVKAGQTAFYPLVFKPHFECMITGKLLIKNNSGTQHLFYLSGIGEAPVAIDHIVLPCKCRSETSYTVQVPNHTRHRLVYKALTDIDCLDGPNTVTVVPGNSTNYTFTVNPWERGSYSGILAFVVDDIESAQKLFKDDSDDETDTKEDEDDDQTVGRFSSGKTTPAYLQPEKSNIDSVGSFRVWYSIDLQVEPSDPVGVIDVECPVLQVREIDIPIKNPTGEKVEFDVTVNNNLLQGDSKITLAPHVPATYCINYSPLVIGDSEASVVFNSKHTGEFWYKLNLYATSQPATQLPTMECQLGKWSRQYIPITNPVDEVMEVEANVSNPDNFSLDVPLVSASDLPNSSVIFHVEPQSSIKVPIQFMPSTLGASSHQSTIKFKSKELGESVYLVAGRGMAPNPMEPVSVSASVGSSTSLIIPFRNPTDIPVLADVTLVDFDQTLNSIADSVLRNQISDDSAFSLLLKVSTNILLEGKQTLDIPFTFSPDKIRRFAACLAISIRREDGEFWPDENHGFEEFLDWKKATGHPRPPSSVRKNEDGFVKYIRYVFPIHGIPEVRATKTTEAVIQCQARSRIEERLEVTLTGAIPSASSAIDLAKFRAVSPFDKRPRSQSTGVIVEGHSVATEFSYNLDYPEDSDAKQHLEQSLAVSLVRKDRDPHTGMVVLVFNLVFSPFRQLNDKVVLNVTSATGGMWKFPIVVRASEPPPDDVITIEAAGLGKESTVDFNLFSHSKHSIPYNAFFLPGSDTEFAVEPEYGELQPQGTSGTRLSLTFIPKIYGHSYKARLVVQTSDMQWAYDVKGATPSYKAPEVSSSFVHEKKRIVKQRPRVNFIRKNLKLTTTAVSSPIKGLPLQNHIKTK